MCLQSLMFKNCVERGDIRFRTGLRNKIIEAIYGQNEFLFFTFPSYQLFCSLDFDRAVKIIEGKLNTERQESLVVSSHYKILNRSASVGVGIGRPSSRSFDLSNKDLDRDDNLKEGSLPRLGSKSPHPLDRRESSTTLRSGGGGGFGTLHKSQSNLSFSRPDTTTISSAMRKELEEQLGDTLYKRAQAKLMIEADPVNIEAALTDVMKAISHFSDDDDFYLVAATCYIRLQRYSDAVQVLEGVLERSPNNYKALYNLAFCRRAEGSQKQAVEDLTKVSSPI
jgi:tetratricopeptide (TPR) repeat protein